MVETPNEAGRFRRVTSDRHRAGLTAPGQASAWEPVAGDGDAVEVPAQHGAGPPVL